MDFYVLEVDEETSTNPIAILLGRPFLKTIQTMINVHDGILTVEFDREVM